MAHLLVLVSNEKKKYHICKQTVYGHFGPKSLWSHHISALCVRCRSVSNFCIGAEWTLRHQCKNVSDTSTPKCTRHIGPRTKSCFECRHCVKNVDPLYIRYSNVMEVLEKRMTKSYPWTLTRSLERNRIRLPVILRPPTCSRCNKKRKINFLSKISITSSILCKLFVSAASYEVKTLCSATKRPAMAIMTCDNHWM